ncbi:MAG TPA: hypothetical protein VK152_02305 [Paludibacter sp.]|nr:hypothetical protein [Paludibacter sp.]
MVKRKKNNSNKLDEIDILNSGVYFCLSAVLIYWLYTGIKYRALYMPVRYGPGFALQGVPALIMSGAILCASINLMTVSIRYYDRRDNKHIYRLILKITTIVGWLLFGLTFISLFIFPNPIAH